MVTDERQVGFLNILAFAKTGISGLKVENAGILVGIEFQGKTKEINEKKIEQKVERHNFSNFLNF
jgi:hypothetical protein